MPKLCLFLLYSEDERRRFFWNVVMYRIARCHIPQGHITDTPVTVMTTLGHILRPLIKIVPWRLTCGTPGDWLRCVFCLALPLNLTLLLRPFSTLPESILSFYKFVARIVNSAWAWGSESLYCRWAGKQASFGVILGPGSALQGGGLERKRKTASLSMLLLNWFCATYFSVCYPVSAVSTYRSVSVNLLLSGTMCLTVTCSFHRLQGNIISDRVSKGKGGGTK
jgi:hypothetical protein